MIRILAVGDRQLFHKDRCVSGGLNYAHAASTEWCEKVRGSRRVPPCDYFKSSSRAPLNTLTHSTLVILNHA
jgi:hypothetical protein